jgi:hypothetical protein
MIVYIKAGLDSVPTQFRAAPEFSRRLKTVLGFATLKPRVSHRERDKERERETERGIEKGGGVG